MTPGALHWIDPELRYAKPHAIVRPGGAMAVAGSLWARPSDAGRQSSTHALGEARSAEFLARVRRRLASLGWPELTATFVGYLIVGRRK
jgi:hypothetical protein